MAVDPASLLKPINHNSVTGNVLIFTWTVPTDTENKKLVFKVELDTVSPISSSNTNYKKYESRLVDNANQGMWQVKNGSGTYITLPSGGIDSTYYGRDARCILRKQNDYVYPDLNTTWYWQISASNGISQLSVFNVAIFAQNSFDAA